MDASRKQRIIHLKMINTLKNKMKENKSVFLRAIITIFLITSISLISINFISADKLTGVTINNEGIDIVFPQLFYYPYGEDITSLIWAVNSSNGVTINNETGYCIFSVTDNVGDLIYRNPNMSYGVAGFEVGDIPCVYCFHDKILSGNLTEKRSYTARYNCKTYEDTIGGAVSKKFEINENGLEPNDAKAIIQFGFIFLLFGIASLFLFLTFKLEQPGLKIFFLFLSFIFLMSCLIFSFIAGTETSVYENFNSLITTLIYAFGLIVLILFIYIMIEQTKAAVGSFQENKGYEMDF